MEPSADAAVIDVGAHFVAAALAAGDLRGLVVAVEALLAGALGELGFIAGPFHRSAASFTAIGCAMSFWRARRAISRLFWCGML